MAVIIPDRACGQYLAKKFVVFVAIGSLIFNLEEKIFQKPSVNILPQGNSAWVLSCVLV